MKGTEVYSSTSGVKSQSAVMSPLLLFWILSAHCWFYGPVSLLMIPFDFQLHPLHRACLRRFELMWSRTMWLGWVMGAKWQDNSWAYYAATWCYEHFGKFDLSLKQQLLTMTGLSAASRVSNEFGKLGPWVSVFGALCARMSFSETSKPGPLRKPFHN